ncbi:PREDICTED: uncharacterized protein LOC109227720 [Nicotiana attenuata]|uniref:uncharacterized protein LOC109227720 n=1 Tax=Nicotiana attenuata TaxID=49451 RepID=UPI000905B50F|nr:PREDICTED: uncharacterized protein LOC109227720 [Nicotiana attenuata]
MKDLWDELDVLVPLSSCDCEEARPSIEHLRSQRVLQFLMGLNETYSNIRSNVLAKRPVVTVNEAYAIVTQEESQRALGVVDAHKEPLTMLAGKSTDFEIIGYPADFKSKKKNQTGGGKVYANSVNVNNEENKVAAVQVIYTRATHHVTYTKDILSNMRRTNDQGRSKVQSPTGNKAQITHTGEASILGNKTVKNILYVPYFKFNLLFVSKLTKDLSFLATFFPDFCMFTDLYSGKVTGIGREHNGLYLLKKNITVAVGGFLVNKRAESKLWHLRLGHAYLKSMQHIPELRNKVDMQNGTVERKHRHILEVARALLFQSSVLMRFWGDCVRKATYLINKLPIRVLQGKCPYEILHNKPAKIEHLRVFGCLCFASNLPGGDKFSPRARKSVIIGYYETQKGYSLFDLDARKVFISRDVSFREQAFLFKEGTQITEDLFPCEPLIPNDSLPEHSLQSSSSEVQITPEESNSSTAHDQVEAAQAPSGTNPIPSQSLTEHVASETADVRKSSRTTRPSIWLKNYVTSSNTQKHPYCISNSVSYSHLSPHYQAYLGMFSSTVEPKSFMEACQDPNWVEAMPQEIKVLEDNATWSIADLRAGKRAIGSKWVFKIKYKENGEIERYKARLIAKGYTQ